ncbi:MAG: hypothetical protein R3F49_07450 [Planctomycetota bacterium]
MSPCVALITEPDHPRLRPDDQHLVAPLAQLGIEAEPVPWGAALDPARHSLAVLRSPWDYFHHAERFLAWCEALPVPLVNPASVVRWNAHKRYLLELQRAGAARISPTVILGAEPAVEGVAALAAHLHGRASDDPLRRLVVKPTVSGGAYGTFVLDPADPGADARLAAAEAAGDVLVQRYERRLVDAGEWSLVFIDGALSHTILKRPRPGDFRVQAEHGGTVAAREPSARLRADAARVLRHVERLQQGAGAGSSAPGAGAKPLAYARVDGFEAADGGLVLVELELIEPELFLRFGGAEALARALAARIVSPRR